MGRDIMIWSSSTRADNTMTTSLMFNLNVDPATIKLIVENLYHYSMPVILIIWLKKK